MEALLNDLPTLTSILTYNLVSGSVYAKDVVGLSFASSVQGGAISVAVRDGTVYLNGNAKVVIVDIQASNGDIHAIDTVILPPAKRFM